MTAVLLGPLPDGSARDEVLDTLALEARLVGAGDVAAALAFATRLGAWLPDPGSGQTLRRWEVMASVAAQDLSLARAVEPHLDALAILHELGEVEAPARSTWGVWAAEGASPRLEASRSDDDWSLTGRKPWCSLAGSVTHALVTAWVDEGRRGLFVVELDDPGIQVEDGTWEPRGLTSITTTPVRMTAVSGRAVGGPGWYLDRPGFAWGGIGVAAIWYGGAVGVARRLLAAAEAREPDQVGLMHLGAVDSALAAARAVLSEAAGLVDGGAVGGQAAALLAVRARHVVHDAAETVLRHAAHGLGPAPLSQEPEHARRVADLELYLRQHHAERDHAAAGRLLVAGTGGSPPW